MVTQRYSVDQLIQIHNEEKSSLALQATAFSNEANVNEYWTRATLIGVATLLIGLSLPAFLASNSRIDLAILSSSLIAFVLSIFCGLSHALMNRAWMLRTAETLSLAGNPFNRGVPEDEETLQRQLDDKLKVFEERGTPHGMMQNRFANGLFAAQLVLTASGFVFFVFSIS